ncbi:peptidase inhibitor family I36 protein [Frankia sp. AgB32]|uniref:peptidase inhibitor family I36 protein n=1 Tax=Frankia sp. AgB32 TaxID=631119 RepID=UPI00200BE998|nr:peptidase inhibitor family I36 protein [Frankia sp. AgB32]MCK9894020.1 peptidase inhibitor family I36 protein [Frankia sp. AgB32]
MRWLSAEAAWRSLPPAVANAPASQIPATATANDQAVAGSLKSPLADRVAAQLRLARGGVKISPNEISWDDGKVVMVFPLDGEAVALASSSAVVDGGASTQAIHGCPTQYLGAEYYCFYADGNYGGRRLQFKDHPQIINFTNYGFDNQASSWVNGGGADIYVYDGYDPYASSSIWIEFPHSQSSLVAAGNNDRASSFRAI